MSLLRDPPGRLPSAEQVADSVRALEEAFDIAGERCGVLERRFSIAGREVLLRFAGSGLVRRVVPGLAHLCIDEQAEARESKVAPDLTIQLWDSATTSTELPAISLLLGMRQTDARPVYRCGPLRFAFRGIESSISCIDLSRRKALWCTADATTVVPYEVAYPVKDIIHWWSSEQGLHLVHAAGVGGTGGGILLPGKGGSGKSTTSLICLQAGIGYAGDDYVLVRPRPPALFSIYSSGRADREFVSDNPGLLPDLDAASGEEKVVSFFGETRPTAVVAGFPLLAVVLPRVRPQGLTRLVNETRGAALLALTPSTVLQLPGAEGNVLHSMAQLLKQLPVFGLDLGLDVGQAPKILADLLNNLT